VQEYVEEKCVALVISDAKLTARVLARALSKLVRAMKNQHNKACNKTYRGKQTMEQLVGQNAGVSSIPITDGNIKAFDPVARKYGIDYALQKDSSVEPPKWTVFFKGRDADAMTAAFSEFAAKTLKPEKQKPSALDLLRKMKESIKEQVVDRTRVKEHGSPEL